MGRVNVRIAAVVVVVAVVAALYFGSRRDAGEGPYAREVAKILGSRVRQVITIGTPFNSGVDSTNVGWLYKLITGAEPKPDPALMKKLRTPPSVPTLSIYSRNDGVVAWQTCRHDGKCDLTEDVEIDG